MLLGSIEMGKQSHKSIFYVYNSSYNLCVIYIISSKSLENITKLAKRLPENFLDIVWDTEIGVRNIEKPF